MKISPLNDVPFSWLPHFCFQPKCESHEYDWMAFIWAGWGFVVYL